VPTWARRQAPDEHLLADVAAQGVALMARLFTDLGTGLPPGTARAIHRRRGDAINRYILPIAAALPQHNNGFEKDGIVGMRLPSRMR
jgi:hypothetical protein